MCSKYNYMHYYHLPSGYNLKSQSQVEILFLLWSLETEVLFPKSLKPKFVNGNAVFSVQVTEFVLNKFIDQSQIQATSQLKGAGFKILYVTIYIIYSLAPRKYEFYNQAFQHMSISLQSWKQKDQKSKAILSYVASTRLAWLHETLPQKNEENMNFDKTMLLLQF